MMFAYLAVVIPYLTVLGGAAPAARPWRRRVSLP
jgi:hypothetical protein